MSVIQRLHHIQLADFRERTRRYSFLIIIGVIVFLSFLTLPPVNQKGKAIRLVLNNQYRAIYNSAFIGSAIVVLVITMLSLFGFYLVKNSIERDYNTGVGQIIATTPTSKMIYLLGKMLSNFFVLAVIVCIIALVGLVLNLIRGETPINIWQLFAPFLFIALPSILLIASIAVLFETIPILRGTVGNIIYFFLWSTFLTLDMMNVVEVFGLGKLCENISGICPNGGINWCYCDEHSIKTVLWEGYNWNFGFLNERLISIVISICFVLISSLFFNRFDSYKVKVKSKSNNQTKLNKQITMGVLKSFDNINIKQMTSVRIKFNFIDMIKAELKLMLSDLSWWWKLVAFGLIAGCLFSPFEVACNYVFPVAWLWPITIWSQMGNKEKRYNVNQIVFSCENYTKRHLPCIFMAGTIVSIIMGSGILVRLIVINNIMGLLMFLLSSMIIPLFALVLGIVTGNNKLFEILYIMVWYFGPINHVKLLNFANIINPSLGIVKVYLLVDILLFVFTLAIIKDN